MKYQYKIIVSNLFISEINRINKIDKDNNKCLYHQPILKGLTSTIWRKAKSTFRISMDSARTSI
jgi:hypothetical protein